MVRQPKRPWTRDEDQKLTAYITKYGIWIWSEMARFAGLQRSGKSCRLRWMNYLKPNLRLGNYTREEDETIIQMQKMLGNRWSAIAARFPQRTDNDIKNHWNTRLKKRVILENNSSASSSIPETNSSIDPEPVNSCDAADSVVSSENNSSESAASISPTGQINSAIEPEHENYSDFVDSTIVPTTLDDFTGPEAAAYIASPSSGSYHTVLVDDNYMIKDNLVSSENYWEIESCLWEQPLMTIEGLDWEATAPSSDQLWHTHHEPIPETKYASIEPEPENWCGADSFVSSENSSVSAASMSPTEAIEYQQENYSVDSRIILNVTTILDDFKGPAPASAYPPSVSNNTEQVDENYMIEDKLVSSENLNCWETQNLWEQLFMAMEGLDSEAIAPNSDQLGQYYDPVDDFWVNLLI